MFDIKYYIRNKYTVGIKRAILNYITKYKYPTLKYSSGVKIYKTMFGEYVTLKNNVSVHMCNIGDFTYISEDSDLSLTDVGKFCAISSRVRIGIGLHPTQKFVSSHPIFYSLLKQSQLSFADQSYFEEFKKTTIGNDVLIGTGAIIISGLNIGDGSIIGAGSIVTNDVPNYAIVAGNPARIIRYRFTDEEVSFLMSFRWWDRDLQWLKKEFKSFHNIGTFISSHKA